MNTTKILVLGTYHFENLGEHVINSDVDDITTDRRQKEIIDLVERLAKFNPTKIAVEKNVLHNSELNSKYNQYLNNTCLYNEKILDNKNEVFQIGFRLGKLLNHPKIYAIDSPVNLPMEEMFEYANKHNKDFLDKLMKNIQEYGNKQNIIDNSIIEIFRMQNDPMNYNNEHSNFYLHPVQIGTGDNYCGANVLVEWYRRNLYIFGNLQKIANPNDRILVLYGAGHCKILSDLVNSYNNFSLVNTLDYL